MDSERTCYRSSRAYECLSCCVQLAWVFNLKWSRAWACSTPTPPRRAGPPPASAAETLLRRRAPASARLLLRQGQRRAAAAAAEAVRSRLGWCAARCARFGSGGSGGGGGAHLGWESGGLGCCAARFATPLPPPFPSPPTPDLLLVLENSSALHYNCACKTGLSLWAPSNRKQRSSFDFRWSSSRHKAQIHMFWVESCAKQQICIENLSSG